MVRRANTIPTLICFRGFESVPIMSKHTNTFVSRTDQDVSGQISSLSRQGKAPKRLIILVKNPFPFDGTFINVPAGQPDRLARQILGYLHERGQETGAYCLKDDVPAHEIVSTNTLDIFRKAGEEVYEVFVQSKKAADLVLRFLMNGHDR